MLPFASVPCVPVKQERQRVHARANVAGSDAASECVCVGGRKSERKEERSARGWEVEEESRRWAAGRWDTEERCRTQIRACAPTHIQRSVMGITICPAPEPKPHMQPKPNMHRGALDMVPDTGHDC